MAIRARGWGRDVGAAVAAEGLDPTPRYEDSRLDTCVYELHVWLLAADRRTVIAQHHVAPRVSGRGRPGCWIQVRLCPRLPSPDRCSCHLREGRGQGRVGIAGP